jgi:hypothetical protein
MLKRISLLALVLASFSSQAAVINLNFNESQFVGQQGSDARGAFLEAADYWQTTLKDNVVLNFDVNYTQLGQGIIGSTSSNRSYIDYTAVGTALFADAKSDIDQSAVNNLGCTSVNGGCEIAFMEDVNGVGTIDNDSTADNRVLALTNANAKALGFAVADVEDATITFNSDFSFDYDRSDGIQEGLMDFVGVTIHEIGHALGFVSGVDVVDANPSLNLDPYAYIGVLDLFRYSDESAAAGVIDMRTGGGSFFSVDGGQTNIVDMSTGRDGGDGQQASHFKDNIGAGILDPTFAYGEMGHVSQFDLFAFDAIGWDMQSANSTVSVSEPYTLMLFFSGLVLMLRRRKLQQ